MSTESTVITSASEFREASGEMMEKGSRFGYESKTDVTVKKGPVEATKTLEVCMYVC